MYAETSVSWSSHGAVLKSRMRVRTNQKDTSL
jgi:hypothetical protein